MAYLVIPKGQRIRAGVSFGEASQIVPCEFSIDYGSKDLEDSRLADADGFIIDANLAWRINGVTSLLFTAASNVTPVIQTAGSGAVLQRGDGVEARRAFRRNLIGSAGGEHFLSREAVVFRRYERTLFRSDFPLSDYEGDEIRVGFRLRR